jgi:hypothetical protein
MAGPGFAGGGSVANLQALASELNQLSTQGVFTYPRGWTMMARVAAVTLIALAVVRVVAYAQPLWRGLQSGRPLGTWGVSFGELLAVGVCVVLAGLVGAVLTSLFPSIKVTPMGIAMSELFGWRRIPWSHIGVLRVMDLNNDQYVVVIPFRGATRPPTPAPALRLIPALLGASRGSERGIVVTSYMQDFDRMLQMILSYLSQAAGQRVPRIEAFLDESAVMPLAQLAMAPDEAMGRMVKRKSVVNMLGVEVEDDTEPVFSWKAVMKRQALLAAPPAVLLVVFEAMRGWDILHMIGFAIWGLVMVAIGAGELPFVAKASQMVGDVTVGSGQFARTLIAYLDLQAPRALLLVVGLTLLSLGLPVHLAFISWLSGVLLTSWLVMRFVQRCYYLESGQTLLAVVGSLIYQMMVLSLFYAIL